MLPLPTNNVTKKMNLKTAINQVPSKDYKERIPKLIDYVYSTTEMDDSSFIDMKWFKDVDEATLVIKDFLTSGGISYCAFSTDFDRFRVSKSDFTENIVNGIVIPTYSNNSYTDKWKDD